MAKENKQVILAKDRTQLANERTLLAYWRTALAFFGAGVLVLKFFPDGVYGTIAELAIIFGIILFVYGTIWFFVYRKKINKT